jgi:hypothetical protein
LTTVDSSPTEQKKTLRNRIARFRRYWRVSVGKRGQALLILAMIWMGLGSQLFTDPVKFNPEHFQGYELIPIPVRFILWYLFAAVAIAAALQRKWPDGFGWAAALFPAVIVFLSSSGSALAFIFGLTDYEGGVSRVFIYGGYAALILLISSWTNEARLPLAKDGDTDGKS